MEIPATVTSKGQITIPAAVREALGLHTGDRVVFRLSDGRATLRSESEPSGAEAELEPVLDFFELAGSVPTPPDVDPADWPAQRAAAWQAAVRGRQ
jgi:antitoxin PrlF